MSPRALITREERSQSSVGPEEMSHDGMAVEEGEGQGAVSDWKLHKLPQPQATP